MAFLSEKAKVLILGTFHMSEYVGLSSPRRQAEIEELVAILARFRPTKIAVEMVPEDGMFINEKFREYKKGTYQLGMNEIFQVGFRLGVKLQHEQIYPTDWMGESEMDYKELERWAQENQPKLLEEIFAGFTVPGLTDNKSIVDYYKELNEPAWLAQLHKMYVNMARIGGNHQYIGMKWLSFWYKRNLIMFANVTHLIESEAERILFIVGGSHATIVTKFLEESGICEIVQPLDILCYS